VLLILHEKIVSIYCKIPNILVFGILADDNIPLEQKIPAILDIYIIHEATLLLG